MALFSLKFETVDRVETDCFLLFVTSELGLELLFFVLFRRPLDLSAFVALPLLTFFDAPLLEEVVADLALDVDLDVDFAEDCCASLHPLFVPPAAVELFCCCLSLAFSLKNLNSLGFCFEVKDDGDKTTL